MQVEDAEGGGHFGNHEGWANTSGQMTSGEWKINVSSVLQTPKCDK